MRLSRYLFYLLAGISFLLGITATVFWIRSYSHGDTLTLSRLYPEEPMPRFKRLWVRTYPGGFLVESFTHRHPEIDYLRADHDENLAQPNTAFSKEPVQRDELEWGGLKTRLGFAFEGEDLGTLGSTRGRGSVWVTIIPFWGLLALTMLLPASWGIGTIRRRVMGARRRHQGQCTRCGYDLRGSNAQCPECGTPVPFGHQTSEPTLRIAEDDGNRKTASPRNAKS